jgi:hypothetical protein
MHNAKFTQQPLLKSAYISAAMCHDDKGTEKRGSYAENYSNANKSSISIRFC